MKKIGKTKIQSQLIFYFAIAVLLPIVFSSVIGIKVIYDLAINRAEMKITSSLNSAREIYSGKISYIESVTRLTASRSFIIQALRERNSDSLAAELRRTMVNEGLDVFTITDKYGTIVARGRNKVPDGTLSRDRFIEKVLRTGQPVSGTDIVQAEELGMESYELQERADMTLTETRMSEPRSIMRETSGMMLKAAVPVFNQKKELIGALYGGFLINRNYDIVNKIKEIVHEGEVYEGKDIGTATIFQNDFRISTNVKNTDGSYAVTTIVSKEVKDAVLRDGKRWVGEAFVVNSWYISAYEPIKDIEGNIIGILYVGILSKPFESLLRSTIITFLGIEVGVLLIITFVAVMVARRISKPLIQLGEVAKKITEGDYKAEFKTRGPREVEELAASLNEMSKQLEKEKSELEQFTDRLEEKVEERSEQLKKVHEQLFRSEKLASLGKLAAGIAHEINNPLTGVLTNSSLLLEDMGKNDKRREDIQVIVNETIRCREIVKRLLDFARQTKPQKSRANINPLIENIILLVRNQASFRNISIVKVLDEKIPPVYADTDQLQQVFINMILNASDAMQQGGTLSITTRLCGDKDNIEITFSDTGAGIPEKNIHRIFDPFFTTKDNGTGLGLSISYGIIERHSGSINVASTTGSGTKFSIRLPINFKEEL